MRVISLSAENLMRLKAVDITPPEDADVIEVVGENEQGKSTLLNSMWWTIAGKGEMPAVPIRQGKAKATTYLVLGEGKNVEMEVSRVITPKRNEVVVSTADNPSLPSPQTFLNAIYDERCADPLKFARLSETPEGRRKQLAILRDLVHLDVDIDALDRENAEDFDKRRDINRDAEALRARAEGIVIPAGTPDQEVDVAALVQKLEEAGRINAEIIAAQARKGSLECSIADAEHDAAQLLQSAKEVEAEAKLNADGKRKRSQTLIDNSKTEAEKERQRLQTLAEQEVLDAAKVVTINQKRGEELIAEAKEDAARIIARAESEAKRLNAEASQAVIDADAKADRLRKQSADDSERIIARGAAEAGRLAADADLEIASAESRAKQLREDVDKVKESIDASKQELVEITFPDAVDTSSVRQRIDEAGRTNRQVTAKRNKTKLIAEAQTAEDASAAVTKAMKAREEQKRDAIARAKMPIEGISFGAEEILYKGFPFSQASESQRFLVGASIIMAANPKLRVIMIHGASVIDSAHMEALRVLAKTHNFQVWVERLKKDGPVSILIEDGTVKEEEHGRSGNDTDEERGSLFTGNRRGHSER